MVREWQGKAAIHVLLVRHGTRSLKTRVGWQEHAYASSRGVIERLDAACRRDNYGSRPFSPPPLSSRHLGLPLTAIDCPRQARYAKCSELCQVVCLGISIQ